MIFKVKFEKLCSSPLDPGAHRVNAKNIYIFCVGNDQNRANWMKAPCCFLCRKNGHYFSRKVYIAVIYYFFDFPSLRPNSCTTPTFIINCMKPSYGEFLKIHTRLAESIIANDYYFRVLSDFLLDNTFFEISSLNFPQRPVTRSFAVFFDRRMNKRLRKQS